MKLWILYDSKVFKKGLSPQNMLNSAMESGIDAEVFHHNLFFIELKDNVQLLYYGVERVKTLPDLVFCRGYNFELLEYFERNGVKVINSSFGMNLIKNKFATHLKVGEIKEIAQPKTMIGKNICFETIEKVLGAPFVMKDNFGGRGERVFLVDKKIKFEKVLKENANTKFIFQQYIKSSRGRDLRCYVVGDKVFGVRRESVSESEFRANISQGGVAEMVKIDEKTKFLTLKIAEVLGLEIGSVDFLFGEGEQLIFCEANGNAAFKAYTLAGINLRKEFFEYIEKKYGKVKNLVQQKKELQLRNNSFEILQGNMPVVVSAPHNVLQIRELVKKPLDLGTGHLLLNLVNAIQVFGILKTNCLGVEGKNDDDANYDENHPYKLALEALIKKNKIKALIDLHSMKKTRPEHINIGINGGENIQNRFEVLNKIEEIFSKNGFLVSIDNPFNAGERTIAHYIAKKQKIFCIQVEINSKLIHLKDCNNRFDKMTELFKEIIAYISVKI